MFNKRRAFIVGYTNTTKGKAGRELTIPKLETAKRETAKVELKNLKPTDDLTGSKGEHTLV